MTDYDRDIEHVRHLIDQIDEVFAGGGQRARLLWDILTALRGPDTDSDSMSLKRSTTMVIRSLAFPKTARRSTTGMGSPTVGAMFSENADLSTLQKYVYGPTQRGSSPHFHAHVQQAVHALLQLTQGGR